MILYVLCFKLFDLLNCFFVYNHHVLHGWLSHVSSVMWCFWNIEQLLIKFQGKKRQSITFPLFAWWWHSWTIVVLNLNPVENSFCSGVTWSWVAGSLHVLYKQVLSLYEGVAGLPSAWQSGLLVPAHRELVRLSLHCDNRKHSQHFPKSSLGGAARLVENHWLICME